MSNSAAFASTPLNAAVNIATANTARDGSGVIGTLYTAPVGGARIDDIWLKARVTTTAGMLRIWLHDGTNYRLLREVLVQAITASGSVASWEQSLINLGIILNEAWSIRVSTDKAESFDVSITKGGTFV
jgi:hypothetical protein